MKKLLIGLTVLFSFIFVSNVSASGIIDYNNEYITFNAENTQTCNIFNYCGDYTINYSISDFENYNNVYLFINPSGLEIIILFTENEITLTDNKISTGYGIITNGKYRTLSYSDWWNNPKYYQYRTTSGSSSTNLGVNYALVLDNIPTTLSSYSNKYIGGTSDVYSQNGNLYIEKMDLLGPTEPELDISVIEKTDYLENIKINFNIWDTEKYIYQYKLTGMEVWEDITENDFEYISYSNNTIYIQMIDKTTNESILNATYTFSNITETIPDITFNESIPNSCKVLKNGTNYIVCKEIKANFNNYYGINNYLWNYSDDRENWTQIYNDKFIDLISENKAIYFKLYDRYTNETLKYMTYNITGIELIPSDLGQYITFNGKYENNNYKLDIIFYNYDNELYNYYYSTDGENWTQLSLAEMSNYASIYSKYKSFNFYKDMTVYVKIEDKEANYINSATYQIKIPNVGLFDTINNFKVDNKILNYFTNIYNQIRTSDLGNYIFMLIVTSIILLIIKSARR